MKIEVSEELKYEGELPDCGCGGKLVPIIRQREYGGAYGYSTVGSNPELLWKCNKCEKVLKP